jgi:toxin ParE1/3/4
VNYRLSKEAENDLRNIYIFGFQNFGEKQADNYFEAIFACFDRIARSPEHFPSAAPYREGYRYCVCGAYTIYFRKSEDQFCEIIRIIGRQNF